MVSILLLTLDRYELTRKYVSLALDSAGYPYELLICDNGSTEKELFDFIRTLYPYVTILNKENKGIYTGLNSLLLNAKGDYFVKIDNDIELPNEWLKKLVKTYEKIPNAGVAGIHCVEALSTPQLINGVLIHPTNKVFGTTFWSREVFNKVGYFNEKFNPYGLGDSEYSERVSRSGFRNFYLNGINSIHKGHDVGNNTSYRKMKNESLHKNITIYDQAFTEYNKTNNYYLPINNQ